MHTIFRAKTPILLLLAVLLSACAAKTAPPPPAPEPRFDSIASLLQEAVQQEAPLRRIGYSIQVGAFSALENAVRLESLLTSKGIDAYFFLHDSGLYKVRFGDHADYRAALAEAEGLRARGLIGNFFIVSPEAYAAAEFDEGGEEVRGELRERLVATARRFLGVPYRWGGTSAEKGFDCSGLTLVCYRLNGLDLPRVSYNQAKAGRWVPKAKLKAGDLVFFATGGGKKVSHVGMYIGKDNFIHAPRRGKTVRVERLSNSFFTRTYMGGRSYL